MKQTDGHKHSSKKHYNLTDLQNALAPFEDALIAHFPNKEQVLERARQRKLRKRASVSALMLCIASLGVTYWVDPIYKTEQFATQLGQYRQVSLADGSQIQLNTNTQIRVNYRLRSKQIYLEQGEATFTVKHLSSLLRPLERKFLVYSGHLQIEDIGTIFNVRQYKPDHNVVTVLQGQVRISVLNRPEIPAQDVYTHQQIEHQHQQLYYRVQPNIDAQVAWHTGYIQLNAIPLSSAILELQRYHTVDVHFNDSLSPDILVSGRFKLENIEQFMQVLPQIAKVEVQQKPLGKWNISIRSTSQP